ncbi:hypothetical protein TUSST3_70820 [Streptomyces sp. TUS-ST3]|uniref:DUF5819 family protein n=1 Tax=Streptomyces sp. TUS-ST3 TaxID=3025591 RepID=UPI00235B4970|nr:DUF5819 family protein [Streptomyces sp. TUS-ST3]GLP70461.1 hypothetical protein TUSST3_70820 [Streptomyces sp. TUS-ST3]
MDAYDGGSNARRRPGAPSEPGDAPESEGSEGSYGPEGAYGLDGPEASGEPDASTESREPATASVPESATAPVPESASPSAGEFAEIPVREPAEARPVPPAPPAPHPEPTDTRPSSDHLAIRPAAPAPGLASAPAPDPRTGIAALSLRYQIGVALALAVVAVAVCVHIGMVFLHVAPQNTVTRQHGRAVEDWVYPEFEQNWKLFAPNPLQQDIAVQVRARIRGADGGSRTTGWYDLSAQDGRAIDGNLLPSHTQQNELRRSWDFFVATHDADNRPIGLRGSLSETYLRRIVVLRLEREDATARGDVLASVQVRSRTSNVPPPKWSEEKVSVQPVYRELPWWAVTADDTERNAR